METAGPALVVLAEDFSDKNQKVWREMSSGGWFVLSENIHGALSAPSDVSPLTRGVRFATTSVDSIFNTDPAALGKIMRAAVASIQETIEPEPVYSINDMNRATSITAERFILAYNYNRDVIEIAPSPPTLQFSSEDIYLLAGWLGGLARSLTAWMMEHGARHFAFISRSGADKPEAAQLISSLREAGANPQVFRGDVSSISESNYAAANSFLDSLACQRPSMGLPATSIALPMVLGVGVVAENDGLEDRITRRGMYGIDEREMLQAFQAAMSSRPSESESDSNRPDASILLGLDPSRLAGTWAAARDHADMGWVEDSRFIGVKALIEAASGGMGNSNEAKDGGEGGIATQAVAVAQSEGFDAAVGVVAASLMQRCASILMMSVEDFALDGSSVGGYGLDSMIGAELRNWLFKTFGLNIPFQELLAPSLTFKGLSLVVLEALGIHVEYPDVFFSAFILVFYCYATSSRRQK